MEKDFKQQEILLMTNTSFSRRQLSEKESYSNRENTQTEQLEAACWNGLLDEMLPGIIQKSGDGKQLFLWQIKHNKTSLEMELGDYPAAIDHYFSIDPYYMLMKKSYN